MSRTKMFRGFGREYWKKGTIIEVFKFSLYLLIPVACSAVYANPELMRKLITKLDYIHYPKAAGKLTPEEMANERRLYRLALEEEKAEMLALEESRRRGTPQGDGSVNI